MRAFISIELPIQIRKTIASITEELKKCEAECKWVKDENLHITLKFLGDIKEDAVEAIGEVMQKTADKFKAFDTAANDLGFFPNQHKPKVLYLSTSDQNTLKNIADDLEKRLKDLGFESEGRFKPHITLARIKSAKNINCLIEKVKDIKIKEPLPIKEIILYKSTLTPAGPTYEMLFKKELF